MIEGKDREETIKLTAKFWGISEVEAAFIWGLEHGTIKGDVIVVKEQSNGRSGDRKQRRD
jgi:hypothetical protein